MKDKALKLMASSIHCVISTLGPNGQPQSALVGFSEDKDLGILIGTDRESRKCKNISSNPRVSIVIADEAQKLEIQYEGTAAVYESDEIKDRLNVHFEKLPATRGRLSDPSQVWVLIEPSWMRYVDASHGMKFEETRQFS